MSEKRKLASIQKITSIQPIEGASNIVLCSILGWRCVSNIENKFKVNDLVVYIEIDSKVPSNNPSFAFLEKRGYKVKTMKFNKFNVISQGLILPVSIMPDNVIFTEGSDVTDILKIIKIDTDEPGEKIPNGSQNQHPIDRWLCKYKLWRKVRHYFIHKKEKGWPSEIPHTDETRIQALWNNLQEVLNGIKKWYITVKIDGQSGTYYYKRNTFGKDFFGIYSRSLRKREGDGSNWDQMATKYKIKEILKDYCKQHGVSSIWMQGEVAGPNIQQNKDKFSEKRFFIFNIYIPKINKYLGPDGMESFCRIYNMEMVPLVAKEVSLKDLGIDDIIKMAYGTSIWNKDALREGIVIREMENFNLNRISFKVISPDFLIKYGI